MTNSDNSELRSTYPDSILVNDGSLSRFRGIAAELEINRNRLYGLMIEYAVHNESEVEEQTFRKYATQETTDGN